MAQINQAFMDEVKLQLERMRKYNLPAKKVLNNIAKEAATYEDAAAYAEEIGNVLSDAFRKWIKSGDIPGAVLTQELADSTIPPALKQGYDLICDVTERIQTILNDDAGIHIAAQRAKFNAQMAQNLSNKAVSIAATKGLDQAEWVVNEPVKSFGRKVVSDTIRANLDFQSGVGLQPIVERVLAGGCCDWCKSMAGRYSYPNDTPDGFWGQHQRCKCYFLTRTADGRRLYHEAPQGDRRKRYEIPYGELSDE